MTALCLEEIICPFSIAVKGRGTERKASGLEVALYTQFSPLPGVRRRENERRKKTRSPTYCYHT